MAAPAEAARPRTVGASRPAWIGAAVFGAGVFAWTLHLLTPLFFASPFQDQWATVGEYRRVLDDGLSLPFLFSQHNEHRLIFPRLVLLADLHFFAGSNAFSRAVTLAGLLAGAGLLGLVAWRGGRGATTALAAGLAGALMLSTLHWQNIVWAFQVQFVWVFVAGAWAAYLFFRAVDDPARTRWGLVGAALSFLVVATFCMANGLVAGWSMLGVAVVTRRPLKPVLVLAAACLALTLLYFHGYQSVGGHSDPTLVLQKPKEFVYYVAMYLGSLGGEWSPRRAFLFGLVGLAASAAAALWVLAGRERRPEGLALVAILGFVVATALVTGVGRLSFGIYQALSPRYFTPSCLFWASLVVFWGLQVQKAPWTAARWAAGGVLLAGAVALVQLQGAMMRYASEMTQSVWLAEDVVFSGADDPEALKAYFPDPSFVTQHLPFLRERRLALFRTPEPGWVGRPLSAVGQAAPGACIGFIDAFDPAPAGAAWRLSGWAWDTAAAAPVQRLVVADGDGRVVGLARGGRSRPDVPKALKQVRTDLVGWSGTSTRGGPVSVHAVLEDGRTCEIGRRP